MPRLGIAVSLAVATALVLAACGGRSSDDAGAGLGSAPTVAPSTASPSAAATSPPVSPPGPTPDSATAATRDPAQDRGLLVAARRGDAADVASALAAGASVDATNRNGATALVLAAYGNHLAAARVLLDAGADPNVADETQQSAYLISTSEVGDDPRLLDLMLASGAEVNAKDRFNGTGLIRAADRGFPLICQRLLDAGLDKDHINRLGWTALHEAIILGDGSRRYVETVRVLAEGGVDVTIPSQRDQVTPLQHAERRGYEQMVQILRRAGA